MVPAAVEAMMPDFNESPFASERATKLLESASKLANDYNFFIGDPLGTAGAVKILYAVQKIAETYRRDLKSALDQGATISISSGDSRASVRDIIGGKLVLSQIEREAISDPLMKDGFRLLLGTTARFDPASREEFGRRIAAILDFANAEDAREAIKAICSANGPAWKRLVQDGSPQPSALGIAAKALGGCAEVMDLCSGGFDGCLAFTAMKLHNAHLDVCVPRLCSATPYLMAMKALGREAGMLSISDYMDWDSLREKVPQRLVICRPTLMDLDIGSVEFGQRIMAQLTEFEPRAADGKVRRRRENLWVLAAADLMGDLGTAAVFLPSSFTSLARFTAIREHLLRRHLLKAVVSLPSGLYSGSSMPMSMLVLKANSSHVRLIDASAMKVGADGRFNGDEVGTVVNLLSEMEFGRRLTDDGGKMPVHFADVPGERLMMEGKVPIDPAKVFFSLKEEKAGAESVRLGDLASVLRGPLVKPGMLDGMLGDAHIPGYETPYLFITLSEVDGGYLRHVRDGLRDLPTEWIKNQVMRGDLLLSRNASPLRMAIAEPDGHRPAIMSSNLYALRFKDPDDALLVYSYFSSSRGREALKAAGTGTLISILSVKKLKDLRIPLLSRAEKMDICGRCRSALERLEKSRHELREAELSLEDSFFMDGKRSGYDKDEIPF